jgi:hypothetical protein
MNSFARTLKQFEIVCIAALSVFIIRFANGRYLLLYGL